MCILISLKKSISEESKNDQNALIELISKVAPVLKKIDDKNPDVEQQNLTEIFEFFKQIEGTKIKIENSLEQQ